MARGEHVVIPANQPLLLDDDDVSVETKTPVQTNHVARRTTKKKRTKTKDGNRTTKPLCLTNDVVCLVNEVVFRDKHAVCPSNDVVCIKKKAICKNNNVAFPTNQTLSTLAKGGSIDHQHAEEDDASKPGITQAAEARPRPHRVRRGHPQGDDGNADFPNPVLPLTALSGAIADLWSAETAALARTKGAVATRNAERATLVGLLQQEKAYVQAQADASPENGPSILEGAATAVSKVPTRPPRVFSVKPGTVSGTVRVVAPQAAHRASYEWQYSTDGGKTWLDLPPTLQARTALTG